MISKVVRGWRVGGLVRYLMGQGRANEHTNQHVFASWDGNPQAHQPAQKSDGTFDCDDLAAALADPAVAAGIPQQTPPARADGKVPRGPVWHCSLRNAAEDEPLTDEQWAAVVEDVMDRTGIAPRGDLGACRWVAIRHADDHVHIAAMMVRQDTGQRVHPRNDFVLVREACREAEERLGLTPTAPSDRTAVKPATRAEWEKARRPGGTGEPSRDWLRRAVRTAAVQAQDAERFFGRVEELGAMVQRTNDTGGTAMGYSVAVPSDVDKHGIPVWFSGGELATDLSLTALARRWASAPAAADPIPPAEHERSQVGRAEREAATDEAVSAIEQASAAVANRDVPAGSDELDSVVHAAGDMVSAVVTLSGRGTAGGAGAELQREVGDTFDRASRAPQIGQPRRWAPVATELRRAAWRLASVRSLVGGGRGGDGVRLVVALVALIAEIAALREEQQRVAQSQAARRSCEALRRSGGRAGARRTAGATPGAQRRPEAGGPGRGARPNADGLARDSAAPRSTKRPGQDQGRGIRP